MGSSAQKKSLSNEYRDRYWMNCCSMACPKWIGQGSSSSVLSVTTWPFSQFAAGRRVAAGKAERSVRVRGCNRAVMIFSWSRFPGGVGLSRRCTRNGKKRKNGAARRIKRRKTERIADREGVHVTSQRGPEEMSCRVWYGFWPGG